MHEQWICPPNERYSTVPLIDIPFQPIEPAEFSYTKKEREWWLRVYSNSQGIPQCAFPEYSEEKGFYRCPVTAPDGKGLEIHHILPQAWIIAQELGNPNALETTLGIALCKHHHDDEIHPDVAAALHNYGADPDGIKRAIHEHQVLAKEGTVFWYDGWDEWMRHIAEHYVARYRSLHPEDVYPEDTGWARRELKRLAERPL